MADLLFIISKGVEKPSPAIRHFQFAKIAKDEGHNVKLFLINAAVNWALVSLDHIDYLIEHKVPIYVSEACADYRNISSDDIIPGVRIGDASLLVELLATHKTATF